MRKESRRNFHQKTHEKTNNFTVGLFLRSLPVHITSETQLTERNVEIFSYVPSDSSLVNLQLNYFKFWGDSLKTTIV